MSEQQKDIMERLNALLLCLNEEGRTRLFDVAKGYEMCLRDNKEEKACSRIPERFLLEHAEEKSKKLPEAEK